MGIVIRRIIFTLTTLLLMLSSFGFSNQDASVSGRLSRGILAKTAEVEIFNDVPYSKKADFVRNSDHITRKLAHFTEYTLLGISLYLMLSAWLLRSKKLPYYLTLILAFLYASTDEVHQIFVSGRGPQFGDVLIDTSGALFGLIIVTAVRFLIKKYKFSKCS
ncbi:MAG: VanZ family protein [Clostridia bacterium]|nr:VanZ family protein [Clostridia bacterium]